MVNSTNFDAIPLISQPPNIKVNLYNHQLASVYKMEEAERTNTIKDEEILCNFKTKIGINADATGYGKTLSMITLVYRDKMSWDMDRQYEEKSIISSVGGRIKKTTIKCLDKLDVTLILVGKYIIQQWYDEIINTPLSVKMINSKKDVHNVRVENYDIILITPYYFNDIILKYADKAWKRFIFDEPGHTRVSTMREVFAGFIWLVTATPSAIWSKHINCRRSFMHTIVSGQCESKELMWTPVYTNDLSFLKSFGIILVKNSDTFIKKSFSMPPTVHKYYKCYNPLYNTVKGFVTPKIMNMISAGNIRGAIKSLGGEETINITELIKKKKLEEIEELNLHIRLLTIRNKHKKVKELKKKVERISQQILELETRYKNVLSSNCYICLDSIKDPIMEPNCQNIFCGKCLLKWVEKNQHNPTCPLCRRNIQLNEIIYIDNNSNKIQKENCDKKCHKTKLEIVGSLIKNNPNNKFIIFSSWDETFYPVRKLLKANKINFVEIEGRRSFRQKSLHEFKTGNSNVIFLNSQDNSAGLNLQEATDIIIYHKMRGSTLNQIMGRANRIGRTKALKVHHLLI
jgi:SNF2 family DNA or RNA helicase